MRKTLLSLLTIFALLVLVACGEEASSTPILTTEDIVLNEGQSFLVSTLVDGSTEGLTFSLTNPQIARMQGNELQAITAGFTNLVVRNESDRVLARIEVIVNRVVTEDPIQEEPIEEVVSLTVAQVKALDVGDDVFAEGIVTAIIGSNLFIQDATGGIGTFLGDFELENVRLGDRVSITGKRAVFGERAQIGSPTNVSVVRPNQTLPPSQAIRSLETNLLDFEGQLVSLPELVVKSLPASLPSAGYSVTLTDGRTDLTVFIEPSQSNRVDIYNSFKAIEPGFSVRLNNVIMNSFRGNVQISLPDFENVQIQAVSSEIVENFIRSQIQLPEETENDIVLPTSLTIAQQAYSVTWISSNENVISTEGAITQPFVDAGDFTVVLTATFIGPDSNILITRSYSVTVLEGNEMLVIPTNPNETTTPSQPTEPTEPTVPSEPISTTLLSFDFGTAVNFGYAAGELTWTETSGSEQSLLKNRVQINTSTFEPKDTMGAFLVFAPIRDNNYAYIELDLSDIQNKASVTFNHISWSPAAYTNIQSELSLAEIRLELFNSQSEIWTIVDSFNVISNVKGDVIMEAGFDNVSPGLYRLSYYLEGDNLLTSNTRYALIIDDLLVTE